MHILSITAFLFVITFWCVQIDATNSAKNKCQGQRISEMKQLKYRSASSTNSNNFVTINISDVPVWQENFGKVYIGYTGAEPIENLPIDECIAIKIYEKYSDYYYYNYVKVINEIKKDEMENYEDIIAMFDHGQISKDIGTVRGGHFLAIFELGAQIFEKELYSGKTFQNMPKATILNLIKEIMKPLEELHKVAIHLDFKPANLLIFYKKKQQKFGIFSAKKTEPNFKLIGLDGAFFFKGRRIGKICDEEIENHRFSVSARYAAPEYLNNEISPKSDIWSAGLVIYEMLLVNYSNAKLTLFSRPLENINNIKESVDKIAELYRGFAITNKTGGTGSSNLVGIMRDSAELHEIGSQSWWLRYGEVIHNILNVQLNAPEIAFLLTNMLNNEPTKRLSAHEILEFLDGHCVPKMKNAKEIPLFGTTNVSFLISSLNAEIKWFKMHYEYEDLYPKLTGIRSMLPKVKDGQKMLLKMLAKRKQICGQ